MVAVPAAIPLTSPLPLTTVATLVLLLVHEPPPVVEDKVVVVLTHTVAVPVMIAGSAFTVTIAVLIHPLTV